MSFYVTFLCCIRMCGMLLVSIAGVDGLERRVIKSLPD